MGCLAVMGCAGMAQAGQDAASKDTSVPPKPLELQPGLFVLEGAVNTGVLVRDGRALLIDCCDSVTPDRLAALGVQSVEMILCTQHRRANTAGAEAFVARGAELAVPGNERALFDNVEAYWADWRNRWHLYHAQPGPEVLARSVKVARTLKEGDTIAWRGLTIRVLDTPGATTGSVSYLLEGSGSAVCFSGDALYGPGQIWELYSLQKGFGNVGDYHGFLGNRPALVASLHKLATSGAAILVPSHGAPINDPKAATTLLETRLDALWRNYTAISALNFYFPHLLDETKDDPMRMKPAATAGPPSWVQRVDYTSFAVISETGAALLIDCGKDSVLDTLQEWKHDKRISGVDACWVTHYHDDHVDSLQRLANSLACPIMTDRHLAEVIEHPQRFFLPCISPCGAPVARATANGESWTWHEFQLTAFHFPGQSFYHSGLLVETSGQKVFFAGDSGAPSGLDDYTCGNRSFLGKGRGFRRCLALWRELQPGYIINQHQARAFAFTPEELDTMDRTLADRERLVAELTPWEDPNFALDPGWVRLYPYDQDAFPGSICAVDAQFTNHGPQAAKAAVEPVLPEGWTWDTERSSANVSVPARTEGWNDASSPNPDAAARIWLRVPPDAPKGQYVVPFRVTWNGRYLGQFRHALVHVL